MNVNINAGLTPLGRHTCDQDGDPGGNRPRQRAFGQMIANGGRWQGRQIVSQDWIDASTPASARTAPGTTGYGYQWWVPVGGLPGRFMARSIYGQ